MNVSASYKPVIEVFSGIGTYGYNVPADHVLAMELDVDTKGRILPRCKPRWVKPVIQMPYTFCRGTMKTQKLYY